MAKPKIYNIILKSLKEHLEKGHSYRLFALYVAIKMRYRNSTLYNPNYRTVMELMGCGYNTACKLLEEARECRLFKFTHEGKKGTKIIAVTEKSKGMKVSKNGKHRYKSDCVYKIENKRYTLRQLVKELEKIRIMLFIIGCSCSDLLKVRRHSHKLAAEGKYASIDQREIAQKSKLGRTKVNALLKELIRDGIIEKTAAKIKHVASFCEDIPTKYRKAPYFAMWGTRNIWKGCVCAYRFITCDIKAKFVHVIWDNRKRLHDSRDVNLKKWEQMPTVDRYFARMEH